MYKDLKNTIINTSYKLFMENGYDQTTVNDICAACSITKTTFYRYIDSKEELLSFYFNDINEKIDELKLNAETHTDYVQQIIDAFDLIIAHMLQFQQELYCQLYISNLKENKGTFNEIDALKELRCINIYIDKQMQITCINTVSDKLKNIYCRLQQEVRAKSRIYQVLGVMSGVIIAIILI